MNPKPEIKNQDEPLVIVENLSKKFCKDLKTSLWYGVKDLWSGVTGNKNERLLRPKEFWAVKDISFELRRGECLGLIGHNGAGKSTLLKILNGLINPDAGKVTIKGRVGALIELGAGFNPILSGRENIYNNGAILGFSRKEIDSKLADIIAFAELEDFIDMPVQNYSSGMKVRLGFAVAAQMEPDVLIIDEVLAVGDLGFRMKCLTRIGELLQNTAVIFVSHTMPQVSRIASKILLLNKGCSVYKGYDVSNGIEMYYDKFNRIDKIVTESGSVDLINFQIIDENDQIVYSNNGETLLKFNERYKLSLFVDLQNENKNFEIHYSFIDKESKIVATLYSYLSSKSFKSRGKIKIEVLTEKITLGMGAYSIGVAIVETKKGGANGAVYYYNSNLSNIKIFGVKAGVAPVQFLGEWQLTT